MNLLAKSGLRTDRVARDLNLLEGSVTEAARHLARGWLAGGAKPAFWTGSTEENWAAAKDKKDQKKVADGPTIAALLMMNACMLQERIASGGWLGGVEGLYTIKNSPAGDPSDQPVLGNDFAA